MAYLDDRIWVHPKWVCLSNASFRIAVTGLCYAHGFGTGGALTKSVLRTIGASKSNVEEIVASGLWERDGNGVRIHDWADYNDDERAARKRKLDADRQRRFRDRNALPNGDVTHDVTRDITRDGHESVTHSHGDGNADVTPQVTRDIVRDVTRDLARARDESESESDKYLKPLPTASGGSPGFFECWNCGQPVAARASCRHCGASPRVAGSNARALPERSRTLEQHQAEQAREQAHTQKRTRKHELAAEAVAQWAHETGSGTDELHTTLDLIETDLHTTFSDQERITLIDQAVTERQQLETEAAP